jgi:1-acyl-sn-glycerol-3-phosphate acyltransferase
MTGAQWRPMRRALAGLYSYAEFLLSALVFLPPMMVVAWMHRHEPGRRQQGRWMRRFGRFTTRLTPLWHFSVEGQPPPDALWAPYMVVANHASTSDPFLLSFLPFDMRFVAKKELFRIPLIGWLLRLGGDIPLQRGDRASVQRMREECLRTLEARVPVLLFPEGTRSPDGELLPFKDGAFQLAIEAQVPVLPVVLEGTRACRPKGSLWFGKARARVRLLEPVPTHGLTLEDVPRLREEVRARIAEALRAMRQGLPEADGVCVGGAGPASAPETLKAS